MMSSNSPPANDDYLAAFRHCPPAHYIDGRFQAATRDTLASRAPFDGTHLADIPLGNEDDVDRAARSAREAFAGWSRLPGETRRSILHRVADLIEQRRDRIAWIESCDTGQPIRFMRHAAARGAANFRYFADQAAYANRGACLPTSTHLNYTTRRAIGPVAVITPWNTPFMLATWKTAPALAAGCTVVHKPAEWSPLSAALLAEVFDEAKLPPGVFNLVHGRGEEAGAALCRHPEIAAIGFVGGSQTGRAVMAAGAPTLKRSHLELGGKNPAIMFDDADFERALAAVTFMSFSLNGQRCTASSRLLVQRASYARVVAQLQERIARIRVGDPLHPDTDLGPLVSAEHWHKVDRLIARARRAGAVVHTAPLPSQLDPSRFVAPTLVLTDDPDLEIVLTEVFGPVLVVMPFDDEAHAISLANDTEYGLAAYLWTSDGQRAHRVAAELDAGMIWINSENVRHLPTPFGGMKQSGIGRDGGDYSFDFYMETKNTCVAYGSHRIPVLGTSASA